ncbi:PepSY domain-containing protein [Paenibacillus sp. N3/727]|uniref:PepSY domain-containing protein n=1 Tax=Paenibacillus sp. N3/727 TaxID=2925845 RepID=UPI001F534B75|nr:PepSY domain-containing protein [Paenibacillus sp. N3/727]UNK20571.1 PepSY domain-containing protein [Paenibacillus sp. N3/727]
MMLNRKMWIGTLSAALLLGGTAVAASGTANGESADSKAETGKSSYISVAQAKKAALKVANGRVDDVDLERKNGKAYYEVEIERAKGDVDVHIDAVSGKVLAVLDREIDNDDDDDWDDQNSAKPTDVKITSEQASAIATMAAGEGKVIKIELDEDDNRYIYEVELRTSKGEADVDIDAVTGKVLSVDHDHDHNDDHDDED